MRSGNLRIHLSVIAMAIAPAIGLTASASGSVLLNDSWADGSRTNTNLPTDSADYVGISSTSGGSVAVSPGQLAFNIGTSSQKLWTYFTSDLSAPDGNQPHNSVTTLNVGDTLTASMSFTLPQTIAGSASTPGRDFRFGLFFDPTDARVQTDVNSDGGGSGNPWQDATGYAVMIPLNSTLTTSSNQFQLAKRTTNNTSLLGSSGALTTASSGGDVIAWQQNVNYTVQLSLNEVSATQMDVTASLLQGATVLSSQTVSDLGSTFGGTSVAAGGLPGSQGIYNSFDQLFFRMSSNAETSEIDFTNFQVSLQSVPEPASVGLIGALAVMGALRRRRRGDI